MKPGTTTKAAAAVLAATLGFACVSALAADASRGSRDAQKRGEYLANFGGCNDCHTPKVMGPNGPALDTTRLLAGHSGGPTLPPVPTDALGPGRWGAITNAELTAWAGPWGISFAANLTPDRRTGLGDWTADQFIRTMRTGKHLGAGRPILPPMPWMSLGALTDADLRAIFAYLHSLEPIENQVPAPVPPK